jgi:hypothetical protein
LKKKKDKDKKLYSRRACEFHFFDAVTPFFLLETKSGGPEFPRIKGESLCRVHVRFLGIVQLFKFYVFIRSWRLKFFPFVPKFFFRCAPARH